MSESLEFYDDRSRDGVGEGDISYIFIFFIDTLQNSHLRKKSG